MKRMIDEKTISNLDSRVTALENGMQPVIIDGVKYYPYLVNSLGMLSEDADSVVYLSRCFILSKFLLETSNADKIFDILTNMLNNRLGYIAYYKLNDKAIEFGDFTYEHGENYHFLVDSINNDYGLSLDDIESCEIVCLYNGVEVEF